MNYRSILLAAATLLTTTVYAQNLPLKKEQLGSNPNVVGIYHPEIATAARVALPSYNDQELGLTFALIAKKYANGFDPLKINAEAINNYFQIKIGEGDSEAQEQDYSFKIARKLGKIYLYKNREYMGTMPKVKGQLELRLARAPHLKLLSEFGIDPTQLHSLTTNLLLMEGVQKLPRGGYSRPTTPVVDDIFTYGQRSIEGIMIEGSHVKVISKDSKSFEGLIINWPRFQMHPGLTKFELKSKTDLLYEVLGHLKQTVNPKHESNVKMAVVLRPVFLGESKVFVPSLKVGLYTRPIGERQPELKAENGELFFVDLMKEQISYYEPREREENTGGQLR